MRPGGEQTRGFHRRRRCGGDRNFLRRRETDGRRVSERGTARVQNGTESCRMSMSDPLKTETAPSFMTYRHRVIRSNLHFMQGSDPYFVNKHMLPAAAVINYIDRGCRAGNCSKGRDQPAVRVNAVKSSYGYLPPPRQAPPGPREPRPAVWPLSSLQNNCTRCFSSCLVFS